MRYKQKNMFILQPKIASFKKVFYYWLNCEITLPFSKIVTTLDISICRAQCVSTTLMFFVCLLSV